MAVLDLSDLESVQSFARTFRETHTQLDVLINNAGIMAQDVFVRTKQGLDPQMGTNHHAHFVLTAELLPLLVRTEVCSAV
jgi:NAD(P)-dependent dehydrogenase (short-subunit alcohol dehydrogenase family)